MIVGYRPEKETLGQYEINLLKQAGALANMNDPVPDTVLESLVAKARYEHELHNAAPDDDERRVRILKRHFAFELLGIDESPEQNARLGAL